MQIEKAPENQENIINLTAGAANAHNTHKKIMKCTANAQNLICRFFSICSALSSLGHHMHHLTDDIINSQCTLMHSSHSINNFKPTATFQITLVFIIQPQNRCYV